MAEKLNAENIEAAVQHLENIQTGKTPILNELKGNIKEKEKKVNYCKVSFFSFCSLFSFF